MKYFIALLIILLVVLGLVLSNHDQHGSNEPVTGLPWQIDILPDGDTRVFGITLGHTTLGEAIAQLGDDMDLAIIAAPHEVGSLEAYYGHYSAGPIKGKLILVLDIAPAVLSAMRKRAFQDGGTRRYHLYPDDLPVAFLAPVKIINFMPGFNLDEKIVKARFGIPAGIIQVREQQQHFLYPDKGLDLILNTDSKEVLQYLPPGEFGAYRARLQPAAQYPDTRPFFILTPSACRAPIDPPFARIQTATVRRELPQYPA